MGLAQIVEANVVDPTQFDPAHKYYDPKSSRENPRWCTVVVGYVETFTTGITLDQLKDTFTPEDLWVVRRGNRLSVMPVADAVAECLLTLARST